MSVATDLVFHPMAVRGHWPQLLLRRVMPAARLQRIIAGNLCGATLLRVRFYLRLIRLYKAPTTYPPVPIPPLLH